MEVTAGSNVEVFAEILGWFPLQSRARSIQAESGIWDHFAQMAKQDAQAGVHIEQAAQN
jgi:hypothetical protein